MAGPITWQNIPLPNTAGINQGMYYAQRGVADGFDSLTNALSKYESGEQAIFKRQDADATDALKAKILGARTVDEFEALRASGALAPTTAPNGARVDQGAINSLVDGRSGVLQKRAVDEIGFNRAMLDEREAPIDRQIQLLAQTDPVAARALLDQNRGIRSAPALAEKITGIERADVRTAQDNLRFAYLGADEAAKQALRPVQLEAAQLGLKTTKQTQDLSQIKIDEAKRASEDAAAASQLEKRIAEERSRYVTERDAQQARAGSVAKELGLPVDQRGYADFSRFDKAQREAYNVTAAEAGAPTMEQLTGGSTAQATNFLRNLRESGAFSPGLLEQNVSKVMGTFDLPETEQSLVGIDARVLAQGNAVQQAGMEEVARDNWFSKGSSEAREAYSGLAKELPNLIDKTTGRGFGLSNQAEDIPILQTKLFKIAKDGIETAPGSGKFVVPPVSAIEMAMRTAEGGWWNDDTRTKNFEKILTDFVRSTDSAKALEESERLRIFLRNKRASELTSGIKAAAK